MKAYPAFLVFAASLFAGLQSPAQEQTISNACLHLTLAKRLEYTLAIPAEDKKVRVRIVDGDDTGGRFKFTRVAEETWEAGYAVGHIIVPLALRAAFASNTNGQVLIEIRMGSERNTNSWQFSSKGVAESIYALRCLSPGRKWAEEMARAIRASPEVVPLPERKHADILRSTSETKLDAAVAPMLAMVVNDAFNAHRAEIVASFGRSLLFYPPGGDLRWSFREDDGHIYAISGCSDRMQAATFIVQLKKSGDGRWILERIYANERFKGE